MQVPNNRLSETNRQMTVLTRFNPLQSCVAYLYPPKNIRKPLGFLMFSGGIDQKHWTEMG